MLVLKCLLWSNYNKIHPKAYFVNVGVPHIIYKTDSSHILFLKEVYEIYNKISLDNFNTTCNVSIVIEKDGVSHIRTFERGVERETGACGTACCAAHYGKNGTMKYRTSSSELITVTHVDNELWLSSEVKKY